MPDDPDRVALPSTTPTSQRFKDVVAIMRCADAALDNFAPEVLAQAAEARLTALGDSLLRRSPSSAVASAPLSEALEPGARAGMLRPDNLTPVYQDGPLLVRRPAVNATTTSAPATENDTPAGERLIAFVAPFTDPTDRHIDFSVIAIDDINDQSFVTTALVTAWGRTAGGLLQQNATWRIQWRRQQPVRITRITSLDYEEAADAAPRFVDCTDAVLKNCPALREQLAHGTDEWYDRLDRLPGVDLLGHVGLAVGDVNNDGLDDLYVAQLGGLPNALLIQNADGTTTDTATAAHCDFLDITRGCLVVDMDNDGDQDLVLSIRNATVILRNDGKGRFEETPALSARTSTPSEFYSIAAADYDNNGFLDLYSLRYVKASYGLSLPVPYFDATNGPPNHLLANLGNWKFNDVTSACGLSEGNNRFSLAAAWEDFDADGDQDLYVANDFGRANLYVNDKGHFRDEADTRGARNLAAGMGVTWADFDHDGRMDLYVSNMYSPAGARIMRRPEFRPDDPPQRRPDMLGHVMGNVLFRGVPGGKFENASTGMRHGIEGWSWGSVFCDINNDGLEDVLVPNGNLTGDDRPGQDIDSLFWRKVAAVSPWTASPAPAYDNGWAAMSLLMEAHRSWAGHQRHVTYLNIGNGRFADISRISGFGYMDDGRALAVTDWDQDGDVDLWIRNRTAPGLRFLKNITRDAAPANHFLSLALEGAHCNKQAIGARVSVKAGGRTFIRTLRAGEGYLAQSTARLHFGLGNADRIDSVTVRWPGGNPAAYTGLSVDHAYRLVEGRAEATLLPPRSPAPTLAPGELPPIHTTPADAHEIVLVERLPLPALTFTTTAGQSLATDAKLGKPFILLFWSSSSLTSRTALAAVATRLQELRAVECEVIPVCIDAASSGAAAADAARSIDPNLPLFPADARLLDIIDIIQQEVLGRADDLILPTAFVVDRLGLLSSILRGPTDVSALLAALRRPANSPPIPGRMLFPQPRNYALLASELRKRGHTDLFTFYNAIAQRRQPSP